MPKLIKGEKIKILEVRQIIINGLREKGWSDADIARVFFNVHRSTITGVPRK